MHFSANLTEGCFKSWDRLWENPNNSRYWDILFMSIFGEVFQTCGDTVTLRGYLLFVNLDFMGDMVFNQ